jgi:hypothetical protein
MGLDVYSFEDLFEDPTPGLLTEEFRGLSQLHDTNLIRQRALASSVHYSPIIPSIDGTKLSISEMAASWAWLELRSWINVSCALLISVEFTHPF